MKPILTLARLAAASAAQAASFSCGDNMAEIAATIMVPVALAQIALLIRLVYCLAKTQAKVEMVERLLLTHLEMK